MKKYLIVGLVLVGVMVSGTAVYAQSVGEVGKRDRIEVRLANFFKSIFTSRGSNNVAAASEPTIIWATSNAVAGIPPTNEEVFNAIVELLKIRDGAELGGKLFDHDFDFNNDNKINADDVSLFQKALLATTPQSESKVVFDKILAGMRARKPTEVGDGLYNRLLDFNHDQKVNAVDRKILEGAFATVTATQVPPVVILSDEQVLLNLTNIIKSRFFQTTGSARYDVNFDLDDSGAILANDFSAMKKMPNGVSKADYDVINTKILNAVKSRFFQKTGDARFVAELDVVRDGKILANDFSLIKRVLTRTVVDTPVVPPTDSTGGVPGPVELSQEQILLNLTNLVKARFFQTTGSARYDADFDLDDSGAIVAADFSEMKKLPNGLTDAEYAIVRAKVLHAVQSRFFQKAGDAKFLVELDAVPDGVTKADDFSAIERAIRRTIMTTSVSSLNAAVGTSVGGGSTPTPTDTPTPSPTETPTPTPTPSPTVSPSPSPVVAPSPTVTPSPSPSPEVTSSPTPSPSASPSPSPEVES
jgi:hypothetical protein